MYLFLTFVLRNTGICKKSTITSPYMYGKSSYTLQKRKCFIIEREPFGTLSIVLTYFLASALMYFGTNGIFCKSPKNIF